MLGLTSVVFGSSSLWVVLSFFNCVQSPIRITVCLSVFFTVTLFCTQTSENIILYCTQNSIDKNLSLTLQNICQSPHFKQDLHQKRKKVIFKQQVSKQHYHPYNSYTLNKSKNKKTLKGKGELRKPSMY